MKKYDILVLTSLLLAGCSVHEMEVSEVPGQGEAIRISGGIQQEYVTRASDSGFADGDEIGIYVVDYDGSTPGELKVNGNRASNLRFTFNESAWFWTPDHEIYYRDKTTHIDVYGYYPYSSPSSIEAFEFEVQKNQADEGGNGKMGGYEASDFLWGKAADVAPSDRTITVNFKHMMALARITLAQGTGFDSAEWASLEKNVITESAIRTSRINLKTGEVTVTGSRPATGTIAHRSGSDWRCIVVPQTIAAGDALFSISVGGLPYSLRKGDDFTFVAGKQHNFTITVNKRSDTGTYEFILSGESITPWENDPISHDAIAREYVIVNVPEAGTLDACIAAAGKDLTKLQNLKITGQINSRDFAVMRYKMDKLKSLNLKEVKLVAGEGGSLGERMDYASNEEDAIPSSALHEKLTLTTLVLPDRLKKIGGSTGGGEGAFSSCSNLSGSLILPEGLEEIGPASFHNCVSLNGQLRLPSTLKRIGQEKGYTGYWDGAFAFCGFVSELILPESLVEIGMGTFYDCKGLYGEIKLPSRLEKIGESAFHGCVNLTGSITIPQTITNIPFDCFAGTGFNGILTLHNGIKTIGNEAFSGTAFKGELTLPDELEVIGSSVFYGCDFSGELVLPQNLSRIGDKAFAYNWRLMGVLEIPQNVQSIGAGAFAHCGSLEGVIFPDALESIRYEPSWHDDGGAFQGCYGIGRIVCKGAIPPYIQPGAFDGVSKDNFTLEVPESSINQYQTATGWKDFKRISAYRNLVIRPSMATAINTSVTRDLVLNADDEWEVESQPDWVTLDRTSGTGKAELKLTFSQMAQGSENREGEVVFKLKDKDYRTRCKVTQYNYQYAEDEVIPLQTAGKGKGINIVILADGYNAKDISEGKLLENVNEAYGYFFDIEPYKSYKDYFNVYSAVSVSPESGIGNINTIIYNRFNTSAKGGVKLGVRNGESDYNEIFKYACKAPTVSEANLNETLIIMVANTTDYGGICYMYDDGLALAYCPMSTYGYPLDFRGVVQHEAGGHGFGKLLDEYIYHNAFIDGCDCTCCPHDFELAANKAKGWGRNLSLSGKMNEVDWSHLIFHPKYSGIVDIFEGGYMHTRSVYRPEQNSCMNNDIPYYNTISRQAMVERIMALAGEEFSLEDFIAKDVIVSQSELATKALDYQTKYVPMGQMHAHPEFMGKRPAIKW